MKFRYIIFSFLLLFLNAQAQTLTSSNLPMVVINTNGQPIPNNQKITADMGIIYNGEGVRNFLTNPFNNYKGKIGIETRGSSSQMFPKKQYAVETRDILGEDSAVSLLGFPKEADWVLSAPYSDKSLIRDALVYKWAREMGRYASRTRFCEVVLNGNYIGIYVLLESVKRDKNRVNISKLDAAVTGGDQLTGGYILKIDKWDGENNAGWYSTYLPYPNSAKKILYQYHYPKPDEITQVQKNYIQSVIYAFENAAFNNIQDTVNGFPKYIDMDSFVDYFIVNEFSKNVDAYRNSAFMYKDRDSINKKFFMGPVWDFNLSLGNSDFYDAGTPQGWQFTYLTTNQHFLSTDQYQVPFWWKTLFNAPVFRSKVNARWNQLKGTVLKKENIYYIIDSLYTLLGESQVRNFNKWPILGTYVWPNYYVGQTYNDEINYLKSFVNLRYDWMNSNMITDVEYSEPNSNITGFELFQNYPNPFNPETVIKFNLPEAGYIKLNVYDLLGKEIAVLANGNFSAGVHQRTFNASGFSAGTYFYKLTYTGKENFTVTKKLNYLK